MSLSKTDSAPMQDLNDSGCVQDSSVCESGYKGQAQLLDLSDDVLLLILHHCSPRDLKALGFTCARLARLVCDHTLWQRVDCRGGRTGPQRLRWLLTHCLCDDTTELKVKGYVNNQSRCLGIQDVSSPLSNPMASVCESGYKGQAQLLDLSDDVLLLILHHCSPRDLKALGFTCARLARLVCDHTLWQRVDCRGGRTGPQRLRWLLTHCLCDDTTELKVKGYVNNQSRCLGIQDVSSPLSNPMGTMSPVRGMASGNVGNNINFMSLLMRRHLPRYTVGPRWPDSGELANAKNIGTPNSDLSHTQSKMDDADSSTNDPGNSVQEPTTSKHKPSGSKYKAINLCNEGTSKSDLNSSKCEENSFKHGEKSSLNNGEVNCFKNGEASNFNVEPSTSKLEPSMSNGELCSYEPHAEPLDVTMPASSKNESVLGSSQCYKPPHCPGPQFTFTTKLMRDLKYICANLTALFIEYCDIDCKTTNISQFPPKLKKLSLRGSRCYNQPLNSSYLCKIHDHLPDLEYLDVSSCDWFEPATLMPLSKVAKLQELYMCHCMRLTECVAYASLAARYGFRELRVLDARGSPLADSEVSALGWLPRLQELRAAPPAPHPPPSEHAHAWADPLPAFHELDGWEVEEPEYFKSKTCEVPDSPPAKDSNGTTDSHSSIAEIRELGNTDPVGDRPWGDYERRIIVIQPNANREMVVQPHPVEMPDILAWMPEAGPSKRRHNDQALDLVKRPRLNERADQLNTGADQLNSGADQLNLGADQLNSGADQLNSGADQLNSGADQLNLGADQLNLGADRSNENFHRITNDDSVECCINHRNNPCPRPNSSAYRAHRAHFCESPCCADRIVPNTGTQIRPFFHNHYYDLVTDSAVFRFGRGENEHVVHLGVPIHHESGTRPDRSNLRVLSLTGYRNITDRSLMHLATAAPHLRLVDFTETNVTSSGVSMFKAIQPDCEVVYSKFGNL